MDKPDDLSSLIERSVQFLNEQREIYGDFTPTQPSVVKPDTKSKTGDVNPTEVREQAVRYSTAGSDEPTIFEQVNTDPLAACKTLEELRALCETTDELKTDLPNTNLVFGVGKPNADLMIVGEAPGENEDKQGEPFVGRAGQLLDKIMEAIQFKRDDIYIANILKHRPPNNRDPKPEERERSLPYLLRQIDLIDPKLILCVGKVSGTTLLNKNDSLKNMRQKFHSFHGRELMVTYHPAALLRNPHWKRPTWEDVQLLRKRYDELGGKP